VVDAEFDHTRLRSPGWFLAFSGSLCSGIKTLLLFLLGLWTILGQKLEELDGSVFVQGLAELVDCRWDLETQLENASLTLKSNIFWPFNKACQVAFRLYILADSKVAGALLD